MTLTHDMPGHLARRFQQIAVAVFLAEVEKTGYDLTPVQYAALAAVSGNPRIDQVTLAGLIAYDRTTITGVVDRLVQKGLVARLESSRDRRARELKITDAGRRTLRGIAPAVEAAQRVILRGLTERGKGACAPPAEFRRCRRRPELGSAARRSIAIATAIAGSASNGCPVRLGTRPATTSCRDCVSTTAIKC